MATSVSQSTTALELTEEAAIQTPPASTSDLDRVTAPVNLASKETGETVKLSTSVSLQSEAVTSWPAAACWTLSGRVCVMTDTSETDAFVTVRSNRS